MKLKKWKLLSRKLYKRGLIDNMSAHTDRQSLGAAFKNAGAGVCSAIKHERNIKIHLVFAALALFLGFSLHISLAEWLAVLLCIALVISLELINSAIEAVLDLVSPTYNSLAKTAKDCAAGAVLVSAAVSVIVALVVFLPKVLVLIEG